MSYAALSAFRRTDPGTSQAAALAATAFAGSQCHKILQALKLHGPMDPERIGMEVQMEAYAVRKRLANLKQSGQAEPTAVLVPTLAGRSQRVWRAV